MKEKEISRQEFDDLKSDVKDLKKVFDKINSIAISTEKLAVEMKYMREEQNKLDDRITIIEEKPVKRYDSIITYIITGVRLSLPVSFLSIMKINNEFIN